MQFKKGSFEVGGVIYPVAIKYANIFLFSLIHIVNKLIIILDTMHVSAMHSGTAHGTR